MKATTILIGVALAALAGCASDAAQPVESTGARAEPPVQADVAMRDDAYEPPSLRVPAGSTVTWTNFDAVAHTVTPVDASRWGSEGSGDDEGRWLGEGDTWSFTFDEAGTYRYYCVPHAYESNGSWRGMVGEVVVG